MLINSYRIITGVSNSTISKNDMTANTQDGFTASASSTFGGRNPYNAFDGNPTSGSGNSWITNTGVTTGHIQLQLPVAGYVTEYDMESSSDTSVNRLPKAWTFKGSNNGSDFDTLATESGITDWSNSETKTFYVSSPGYYEYYRVDVSENNGDSNYIEIHELTFKGYSVDTLISKNDMTSNSDSSYVVSSSSYYGAPDTYYPYKAFNGTVGNEGWITVDGTTTGWIKMQIPASKVLKRVKIAPRTGYTTAAPESFTIQGSMDDSNWTTLSTLTGETSWSDATYNSYDITNDKSYKYYKIDVTANNGHASYLAISEIQLRGY